MTARVICAVALGIILVCVRSAKTDDEVNEEEVSVIVTLIDGSHLIGIPSISSIPLKTTYGEFDIPLGDLWGIRFPSGDETTALELRNGDLLTGALSLKSVKLSTLFGHVSLQLGLITFLATDTRSQTLLPANWHYYDLLPAVRDPSEWKGRSDIQYQLQASFDAGVNVDGPSDCDLAVSRTGLIALSDLDSSHTISVYSPTGELLTRLHTPHHPSGVAFSPSGGILVSSNFGPLKLLTPKKGRTEAYNIRSTDDVSTGWDGKTYAIDSQNAAIVALRKEGVETIVKLNGYQSGMKKIFIDARGRIFLADWTKQTVVVYSHDGLMIHELKTKERPWSIVASGSLICYSTSRQLVFHDIEADREVNRIETAHRNSALALGPSGELITIDESKDRIHIYKVP
jgi:hypothetical protein